MTCSLVTSSPPIRINPQKSGRNPKFCWANFGWGPLKLSFVNGIEKILSSKFCTNMLVTPVEPKTAVVDDIGCWKGVEELLAGSVWHFPWSSNSSFRGGCFVHSWVIPVLNFWLLNFSFKSFQFCVVRLITFSLTFGFDEEIRFFHSILFNLCIILITVDAADLDGWCFHTGRCIIYWYLVLLGWGSPSNFLNLTII